MSRDDYISKLFIDNEHKLDEAPSGGLWDRLESKLDQEMPLEQPDSSGQLSKVRGGRARGGRPTSFMRLAPYMAAASVLILIVAVASIMNLGNADETTQALAETRMEAVEDVVLEEETQAIITSEEELQKQFAKEEKIQEEKIIKDFENSNTARSAEGVATLDDVKLKESESNDIILIEPENTADNLVKDEAVIEVPTITAQVEDKYNSTPANQAENEPQLVKPQDYNFPSQVYGENYNNRAYGVPPSADPSLAENLKEMEDVSSKNTAATKTKQKDYSISRKGGLRSRKANKKSTNRKSYEIHPRIRIFDWMLGEFQDKSLDQGKSIESWRLLNPNTIEGVGVLMRGKDKIFEEKILIVHDPTQNRVFLKMYVDESKQQLTYLLTNFDTERIIFEQAENSNYPNKVIFQRLMNGFSTIIQQDNGFIEDQQQRYLNHRNNVSNVRAVRDLEVMD